MDIVHRLHYLVLSQKSDLMTMEREQRIRMRRQSSLPEYSKANKTRQRLEQAYFNDRELFAAKADSSTAAADRKLSSSSAGSMKNKWLKAFRSLKPPSAPPPHAAPPDKRNGATRDMRPGESDAHNFQEYTYKKITPCDVCSQVLRGHTRQGLRCRMCKMNVHTDCMPQVGKCQTKSKLLRRQKSTSEIEAHRVQESAFDEERVHVGWLPGQRLTKICFKKSVEFDDDFDSYNDEEEDQTYQVLKRANEIAKPGGAGPVVRVSAPEEPPAARSPARPSAGLAVASQPIASSSGAAGRPEGGMRRRLFAGVKSLSMWGSKSRRGSPQHRSVSLPEKSEETTTRPFGQPLCFINENGDPPPSILKPTASVRKKK
ncbi:unnamed protein product [Danaus chrysippus]|uniref:(African queen) hypothetical protein n=1 Tax=Danaus chrysippus TaxID=151541 RepID=A0A8J2QDY4_9NEOP|nr:unnamed protein product [Danaus chrysippus]